MISGIAIVGGNGSGKTTLGKLLAKSIGYTHMDVEDYYFKASPVPYANPRTKEEVQKLLLSDMNTHGNFVFSSVGGDMGAKINAKYNLIIYIKAPLDIRLERVKRRAYERFGDRVRRGGDMYEQEQDFFNFVATRALDRVDAWVKTMECPVFYVDGCKSIVENVRLIIDYMDGLS